MRGSRRVLGAGEAHSSACSDHSGVSVSRGPRHSPLRTECEASSRRSSPGTLPHCAPTARRPSHLHSVNRSRRDSWTVLRLLARGWRGTGYSPGLTPPPQKLRYVQRRRGATAQWRPCPFAKGTEVAVLRLSPSQSPAWSKPRKATRLLSFTSRFDPEVQGSAPHTEQARGERLSICPSAVCAGSALKTEFFASVSSPEQIPASGSLAGDLATDLDPAQAAPCHSHGPSPNSDPEPQHRRPRA